MSEDRVHSWLEMPLEERSLPERFRRQPFHQARHQVQRRQPQRSELKYQTSAGRSHSLNRAPARDQLAYRTGGRTKSLTGVSEQILSCIKTPNPKRSLEESALPINPQTKALASPSTVKFKMPPQYFDEVVPNKRDAATKLPMMIAGIAVKPLQTKTETKATLFPTFPNENHTKFTNPLRYFGVPQGHIESQTSLDSIISID